MRNIKLNIVATNHFERAAPWLDSGRKLAIAAGCNPDCPSTDDIALEAANAMIAHYEREWNEAMADSTDDQYSSSYLKDHHLPPFVYAQIALRR